jgi:hypothetical protein
VLVADGPLAAGRPKDRDAPSSPDQVNLPVILLGVAHPIVLVFRDLSDEGLRKLEIAVGPPDDAMWQRADFEGYYQLVTGPPGTSYPWSATWITRPGRVFVPKAN